MGRPMKKPLETCANGCGVPPAPPSLVICRPCQDKITEFFKSELARHEDVLRRAAAKGGMAP
jgi:hypothetical protein